MNSTTRPLPIKWQSCKKAELDDDEYIALDYDDGSFSYQLPFTINIENTKKQITSKILKESNDKIKLENITIYENGLIKGNDFKTYEDALYSFMDTLAQLRRNI